MHLSSKKNVSPNSPNQNKIKTQTKQQELAISLMMMMMMLMMMIIHNQQRSAAKDKNNRYMSYWPELQNDKNTTKHPETYTP